MEGGIIMQIILNDLDNCNKVLLDIKKNYDPMYRNLLLFWTKRRDQLKQELYRNNLTI